MQSARSGNLDVVKYVYTLDNDVKAQTGFGRTVIHTSINGTSLYRTQAQICDVIRFLVGKGADPDPQDQDGWSAISMADIYPVEDAVEVMYQLTLAAGREVKILPVARR